MKKITVENLKEVAREIKKVERSLKRGETGYSEVTLVLDLTSELLETAQMPVDEYNYKIVDTICLYGKDFKDGREVRTIPEIVNNLKRIIEERL